MVSNIIVGIMCVIALAAGVFGWWMENGGSFQDSKKDDDIKDNDKVETEVKREDEEN